MGHPENNDKFVPMPPLPEPSSASESTNIPTPTVPVASGAPTTAPSTSGMAIAGLVCAFIFPLLGVIFSIIGINQTKNNKQGGRGIAIAGLIVSVLNILANVLFLVAFIITASIADKTSSDYDYDRKSSTTSSITSQSEDTRDKAVKAKINEPARDGNFEFIVKSIECNKTSVGDQYYSVTPQGEFCLVSMSVKNIGDEPQGMYSGNQYLYNAEGQKFSSDSSATTAHQTNGDLWLSGINPGNSVEGVIVFDVTKGMKPSSIELHDSLFSDGILVEL